MCHGLIANVEVDTPQLQLASEVHKVLVHYRLGARVYEGFGSAGGFLVVVQLLASLQRAGATAVEGARVHRAQLLHLALTILCDAITYSATNLRAFDEVLGWDSLLTSLQLAASAGPAQQLPVGMVAGLFGVALGNVSAGAALYGEAWRAARSALRHDAAALEREPAQMYARLSFESAYRTVVHPRALECAFALVEGLSAGETDAGACAVRVAALALLDALLQASARNVVLVARTALLGRLLHRWPGDAAHDTATPPGATANDDEAHAAAAGKVCAMYRACVCRVLLADGFQCAEDARRVFAQLERAPTLDACVPLLELLGDVALETHRPPALHLSASAGVSMPPCGMVVPGLQPAFPDGGFSIALVVRLTALHAAPGDQGLRLHLVQVGDEAFGAVMRFSVCLGSRTLEYAPGGRAGEECVPLPRAQLELGKWHHLVLTHAPGPPSMPTTVHAYLDGQRVGSVQARFPGSLGEAPVVFGTVPSVPALEGGAAGGQAAGGQAAWSLGPVYLFDGVLPPSLPLLLHALFPQYDGNLQSALARFLNYRGSARVHQRLDELAARSGSEASPAAAALRHAVTAAGAEAFPLRSMRLHLSATRVVRTDAARMLNQALPDVRTALRSRHGHARICGAPTVAVPQRLDDAVWRLGGCTLLLRLVERATTPEALAASVRLLLRLTAQSWRLAEDAERTSAYEVLGLLLYDRAHLVGTPVLEALLDAVGCPEGMLSNALLYRVVLLDVHLWARCAPAVRIAYLEHFASLLGDASAHRAANARKLAKVQLVKRLLCFAKLVPPEQAPALAAPLAAAVRVVLEGNMAPSHVQVLLIFLATELGARPPQAGAPSSRDDATLGRQGAGARVRAAEALGAGARVPAAEALGAGKAPATALLAALVDTVGASVARLGRLAEAASAKWLLLLLRPGIPSEIADRALELIGMLLNDETLPFAARFAQVGGFRVLERALPARWDTVRVLPWLWTLFFRDARPVRATLYGTFAPRRGWPRRDAPLVKNAPVLRTIVLCVSSGIRALCARHERGGLRRRRSLPPPDVLRRSSAFANATALLDDSVQLLVRHAAHPEVSELLLLAPTMVCVLEALLPLVEGSEQAPHAHRLSAALLTMLAARIGDAVLDEASVTPLCVVHASMPTPDPRLQSRLCAAVYEAVLRHVLGVVRDAGGELSRTTLSALCALLELTSNESVRDARLQAAIMDVAAYVLAQVGDDVGRLASRTRRALLVSVERNVLHGLARDAAAHSVAAAPLAFARRWIATLATSHRDKLFFQCLLNRALAALHGPAADDALVIALYLLEARPELAEVTGLSPDAPALEALSPDALPFKTAWASVAADQDAFLRSLRRERDRQLAHSVGHASAQERAERTTQQRLDAWHASLLEVERVRFGRFMQDAREDAGYARRVWTERTDAEARGGRQLWRLDPTEGPCRARLKLQPVGATEARALGAALLRAPARSAAASPAERAASAPGSPALDLSSALDSAADISADATPLPDAALQEIPEGEAPAPAAAAAPAGAAGDAGAPGATPYEDKFRCVLRSLEPGDAIEQVLNSARVIGVDVRGTLLVVGRTHLYLLDDYFQRANGELVSVSEAPDAERDQLVTAALAGGSAAPSDLVTALDGEARARRWRWPALRACFRRAWLHRRTALELFFTDGHSCLLVLPRSQLANRLYAVVREKAPAATGAAETLAEGLREPAAPGLPSVLRRATAYGRETQAWLERRTSNAHYLVLLNTLAGRTMNDLTQFPVFPWVLAEYTSGTLDLDAPHTFRQLDRPMGAQTAERAAEFAERYKQLQEMDMPPFHYGTHYSTAASVCSFLVRLLPYAQVLVELQGGSFDLADRMFSSVARAWHSASALSGGDVRELVPEFFYLPEMFCNTNQFDLGRTQSGAAIDNVELPPWAHGDPRLFVLRHREALESEHVSTHLHAWIDLVFGHRAHGDAAVRALNVFHPLSYANAIDIERIESPLERQAAAQAIHNFGQTPTPLFSRPHPPRAAPRSTAPWDPHAELLAFPALALRAAAPTGRVPGAVAHLYGSAPPPISAGLPLSGTPRGQLLYAQKDALLTSGYLDGSVRLLHASEPGTPLATLEQAALGTLTAVCAVGPDAVCLGSSDGLTQLYALPAEAAAPKAAVPPLELLAVWPGHTAAVLCAAASPTWGILVTGSADRTAIVWDVNRREYLRTLQGHEQPVSHVAIDDQAGYIATVARTEVHLWSINGELLARESTHGVSREGIASVAFLEREFHVGRLAALLTGHRGAAVLWQCVSRHEELAQRGVHAPEAQAKGIPLWRLEQLHTYQLPSDATEPRPPLVTAVQMHSAAVLAVGDELGRIHTWALPGHAVPLPEGSVCAGPTCERRFRLLEPKRTCAGCGGVFCNACSASYALAGNLRFCSQCAATLQGKKVVLG